MVSKAYARFIRISPRKMRMVVDVIRGKGVHEALNILANLNKRGAELAEDILRSAMANAKKDPNIKDESLYISKMMVDGGPVLKRFRAMSMGRAGMIRHRTSHISLELDARQVKKIPAAAAAKKKATKRGPRKKKE